MFRGEVVVDMESRSAGHCQLNQSKLFLIWVDQELVSSRAQLICGTNLFLTRRLNCKVFAECLQFLILSH
jgi:hypothetical protein